MASITTSEAISIGPWLGGKPAGCMSTRDVNSHTYVQVIFSKELSEHNKTFSSLQFGSKENTEKVAAEYRQSVSDQLNITKNKYRFVENTETREKWLEVQLQNDLIMKCECTHLDIANERIWTAHKSKGKYTFYVKSRESKKREQEYCLFHRRVYTQFDTIDHINRDGLDNRACNVREGSGNVNPNNKRIQKNNTSGVKGVLFEDGLKARWIAQWNDKDGKRRKKSFGIKKYGAEKARELAIEARNENHKLKLDSLNMEMSDNGDDIDDTAVEV